MYSEVAKWPGSEGKTLGLIYMSNVVSVFDRFQYGGYFKLWIWTGKKTQPWIPVSVTGSVHGHFGHRISEKGRRCARVLSWPCLESLAASDRGMPCWRKINKTGKSMFLEHVLHTLGMLIIQIQKITVSLREQHRTTQDWRWLVHCRGRIHSWRYC